MDMVLTAHNLQQAHSACYILSPKGFGSQDIRSTWLSAAKCTIASILCWSHTLSTSTSSRISLQQNGSEDLTALSSVIYNGCIGQASRLTEIHICEGAANKEECSQILATFCWRDIGWSGLLRECGSAQNWCDCAFCSRESCRIGVSWTKLFETNVAALWACWRLCAVRTISIFHISPRWSVWLLR